MPKSCPEDKDEAHDAGTELADLSLPTAITSADLPLGPQPPSAQTQQSYLIREPIAASSSPTGRGTKGYIGYHLEANCLVFIKDCWRADVRGVHPELEIYSKFKEAGVRYVAEAIGGGDVEGTAAQVTLTQDFMEDANCPARRIHYHVVLKDVGRPLQTYEDSFQMAVAICYALMGAKACSPQFDTCLIVPQVITKHGSKPPCCIGT